MLRILLIVIIGAFLAMMVLRAVAALVMLVIDFTKGAKHAPVLLGALTGSVVLSLVFG